MGFLFVTDLFSQPVINFFTPTSGPVGTTVTIKGTGFSTIPANNIVYFTIYFQGSTLQFSDILLRYVFPTAVYTSIFGILPVIFERRKRIR